MQILFIRLLEIIAVIVIIAIFASEIIIPIIMGRPLFPFFRKQRDFEKQLRATRQDLTEVEIQQLIRVQEDKLKKARTKLRQK